MIRKKAGILLDTAECFVTAVFAILFMFTFLLRTVIVTGHSMEETVFEKDRLVTSTLFYSPQQGDVVVINSSVLEETIVKRIIAVGSSTVEIDRKNKAVYVDGKKIEEEYVSSYLGGDDELYSAEFYNAQKGVYEYVVPYGYVFVMGDNREYSTDSRKIGIVSRDEIVGKVLYRLPTSGKYKEKFSV